MSRRTLLVCLSSEFGNFFELIGASGGDDYIGTGLGKQDG